MDVKIDVVLDSGKRMSIEVETDMYAYEIPDRLIEEGALNPPPSGKIYELFFKERDHQKLDMDATLEENDVRENDTLMIHESGVA